MKADTLAALRSQKLADKPKAAESPLVQIASQPNKPAESAPRPKKKKEVRTTSTMSLYSTDLQQIKKIRRLLEDAGVKRVSDSEAVRVALRVILLKKETLMDAYGEMSLEDGRKTK